MVSLRLLSPLCTPEHPPPPLPTELGDSEAEAGVGLSHRISCFLHTYHQPHLSLSLSLTLCHLRHRAFYFCLLVCLSFLLWEVSNLYKSRGSALTNLTLMWTTRLQQ